MVCGVCGSLYYFNFPTCVCDNCGGDVSLNLDVLIVSAKSVLSFSMRSSARKRKMVRMVILEDQRVI